MVASGLSTLERTLKSNPTIGMAPPLLSSWSVVLYSSPPPSPPVCSDDDEERVVKNCGLEYNVIISSSLPTWACI